MPAVSERQRRAMFAAAEGRSTLGIPKAVGEEFVGKDEEASRLAAGVIFVAPDGAVLLLCRSDREANFAGHWALPGGGGEPGETPWQIVCREAREEIGRTEHAWTGEPTVADERVTPKGMVFTTFVQPVRYRFAPELNDEHSGFVWARPGAFPSPMHPAVAEVLAGLFPATDENAMNMKAADMKPDDWRGLLRGLFKWIAEEAVEPEHADDNEAAVGEPTGASDSVAMDRATVRTKDADGHLRVEITPISKANVCPYYGREIPNWQGLGLDADKVYNLYRDADELAKGAKTFAGKPLLLIHKPVNADDHPREITVGAVGDAVVFDPPYLKAPLTIWDGDAIDLIESNEQRELSSSYRYVPVMVPGIAPDGQSFDGRMTDIVANHVALVANGRAGPDVLVQDTMPAGLAATNPNSGIPVGGAKRAPAQDTTEEQNMSEKAKDRARDEDLMEKLKEKLSSDEYEALGELLKGAKAEDEETDAEKRDNEAEGERIAEREKREKAEDEAEKEEMAKAMDARLDAALTAERERHRAILEAERFVRPWVGELANVHAYDSAADIYKAAIEARGKSVTGVHPSAYRSILEMMPKAGAAPVGGTRVAMDSAASKSFAERFPDAARIRVN